MKTLKEKRIETLNDKLEPSKEGLYFGEDVKEKFKDILNEIKKRIIEMGDGEYSFGLSYAITIINKHSGFEE